MTKLIHLRYWSGIGAGIILGLVFVLAGAGKLTETSKIAAVLTETLIIPEAMADAAALGLPWLEILLGLLLVMGILARPAATGAGLLTIGFIFHNTRAIALGLELNGCGCFGILEMGPLASFEAARYMDIGMLVLATVILLCYPVKWFDIRPWFFRIHRF